MLAKYFICFFPLAFPSLPSSSSWPLPCVPSTVTASAMMVLQLSYPGLFLTTYNKTEDRLSFNKILYKQLRAGYISGNMFRLLYRLLYLCQVPWYNQLSTLVVNFFCMARDISSPPEKSSRHLCFSVAGLNWLVASQKSALVVLLVCFFGFVFCCWFIVHSADCLSL